MFKNPLPKARPEQIADELHLREKRPVNEMSVRNPCARNELGPDPELRREDAHRKAAVSHHTVKEPHGRMRDVGQLLIARQTSRSIRIITQRKHGESVLCVEKHLVKKILGKKEKH